VSELYGEYCKVPAITITFEGKFTIDSSKALLVVEISTSQNYFPYLIHFHQYKCFDVFSVSHVRKDEATFSRSHFQTEKKNMLLVIDK